MVLPSSGVASVIGETLRYDAQWVLLGNAPGPLTPTSATNKPTNAKELTDSRSS
jgi:hypothetical protein